MQSLQTTAEAPAPTLQRVPRSRARLLAPASWQLPTRLTLVVVLLMVPLELIVGWSALAGLSERRAAELENAVLVGQALAAVVDGFAGDLQSTTLATAIAFGGQPGPLNQASAGEHLQMIAAQYPTLRAMFLTDPDGRLIATGTGGELGFDLSSRPYIRSLRAGAETVWSGSLTGIQTGETTIAFGRVVRGLDGAPRGFLVMAFYPQLFVERLPVTLPSDARVTVVDNQGQVLYDNEPSGVLPNVASSQSVQAALGGQIVRIAGATELRPGEARFGALVPIPRLRWAVGYTLPLAAVEADLTRRSLVQAGSIALVIVIAACLMVVLTRRLTRPLTMLAETADAIAGGAQPTVPPIESAPEVQQLAVAMRLMGRAVADREADLRAEREWLQVTLSSIGDAVLATDASGRVSFMNGPAAELSGWAPEEARGLDVNLVLQLRNEHTGVPVDSPVSRVLRDGQVVGLANHTMLVTRSGEEHPIDDSAAPIRNEAGELLGVVMVFRDVAERRRAEDRMRESEERLRLAVGAAPVVLFNHDRELRYTWVGKPFAGFAVQELLGKTDAELFPPRIAEAAMALKRRALDGGARVEGEIEITGVRDGDDAPSRWELTAEPVRDETGAVVGLTCAGFDVTERRALERLQQEFISLVSHELRNPLASIKGYAQLVLRRAEYNDRATRAIIHQTDHLDRLISDLLDSSRAAAGRLELRRRRMALAELLEAAVERTQAQTDRHTVRLELIDGDLAGLWDAQRLDQVLINLLSNAVKYSPDGGEIVVSARRLDDEALVTIRDQGLGIASDQLARLFDRFYRVTATASGVHGLGIGLFVARQLVEAHGGRLWADSAGPGQGSTFSLTLPLAAAPRSIHDDTGPVLVVDDDDSLRELIADMLRDEGYRLLTARDGEDALAQIAAERPALILLDWMMPRMGGEPFAAALRERYPDLDVPIVVMTAGGEAHARAVRIGAEGSINKPFEIGVLLDQVSRHLSRPPAST